MEAKMIFFKRKGHESPATQTTAGGNKHVRVVRFTNQQDYIKLKCATNPQ